MEFVNTNLETLWGYIITAQAFAWNHKLEIGITLYALLPTFWGRRFWLNTQLYIMFVICGLPAIFSPQTYLSYMSETSDKVNHIHIYLVRWIGILILSQVLSFWLLSKSSDSTIETSQLCAYTIGYLMLMTVTAVGQMRNWGNTSLKGVAIMSVDEILLVFNSVVATSVDVPKYLTKTFLRRIMQVPQDIQRIVKRRKF